MGQSYFTRDGFKFLTELKTHNTKDWFEANKERYEAGLKSPGFQLVRDLEPELAKVSKHLRIDTRGNGGSMSRIHRDTRFSKDKSPYKIGLFFHFYHEAGSQEGAPAYFMHVEPGATGVGCGIWRPAAPALQKIRQAIVEAPDAWEKAKGKAAIGSACQMHGESLKNVPRGFDPAHPLAEDLKRKDFGLSQQMSDKELLGDTLVADLGKRFKAMAPFLGFLCEAVGLEF